MGHYKMDETESLDNAIDDALGENPRAFDLENLIRALTARRQALEHELQSAGDAVSQNQWKARITETERQIEILQREQAISGFVEQSVRASAARPRSILDLDEIEDALD